MIKRDSVKFRKNNKTDKICKDTKKGSYICSCKKGTVNFSKNVFYKEEATQVNKEGICVYCGHYAFYHSYN